MWICFIFIIFTCVYDAGYNVFWEIHNETINWHHYVDSDIGNAFIFLFSRIISWYLACIPIIPWFLGKEMIYGLSWYIWVSDFLYNYFRCC